MKQIQITLPDGYELDYIKIKKATSPGKKK